MRFQRENVMKKPQYKSDNISQLLDVFMPGTQAFYGCFFPKKERMVKFQTILVENYRSGAGGFP